ncbi:hypothetical protein HPB51_020011 [Rhipicephalus microplus]|uniref:Uncharacterized protein n=1 Tax=Rhipicephalus microplus TaxID=6941 RepID=A0A9J6E4A1_RHIMP|nr:hypothetical protein HPB51_020011 [Rhipicephalus microplus]
MIYYSPEPSRNLQARVVEATTESKNIKRESKVYSFKEQMEEIELKKELEAKKKSKVQEPELTKKQKEVMDAQLQKEHAIRLRIRKLAGSVERAMLLLDAVMAAPASTVCQYGAPLFPQLVQALTALFNSRLAAPIVVPAYLRLKDILFTPDLRQFAASVGYLMLRLAKPCCEVDPRWTEEDLDACMQRVVTRFHDLSCSPTGARRLPSPAFCFTFPLLRLMLSSPDTNDILLTQCLQVLSAHSVMRCTERFSVVTSLNHHRNCSYSSDKAPLSSQDESVSLAASHSASSSVPSSELLMQHFLKAFSTMESGKKRQAESTQPQTVASGGLCRRPVGVLVSSPDIHS